MLGVIVSDKKGDLLSSNLNPIVEEIEAILKLWTVRGLLLIGKVQVINTLIISRFTYRLAVIPKLSAGFLEKFNNLIKAFLWDGGRAKISSKILKGLKQNGGAALTDLGAKDKASKLQWVSKCIQNSEIQNLADAILDNPISTAIWKTKLEVSDIKKLFPLDSFWRDVLILWNGYNNELVDSPQKIRRQVLWLNSEICIQGKPTFNKKLYQMGIITTDDILGVNGNLLMYEQILQKLQGINYLEYYAIRQAIPKEWIAMLKTHCQDEVVKQNE